MNDVIRELTERKSVRVFEDKEISKEDQSLILQAATQAPTAGNQQLYTILQITKPELKERLAETCDHQPFIATAKMVLIFCADCHKWYEGYKQASCQPRTPDVGDFLLACSDANIAAQNAVSAAWSLGIGSCYIGDIMERYEEHKELLDLPAYVFPVAMVVFGYPTDQQKERIKPQRVPMEFIVFENGYPTWTQESLQTMWEEKTGDDYTGWMQRFCQRKYNSDFSEEMSRSVRAFLDTLGE